MELSTVVSTWWVSPFMASLWAQFCLLLLILVPVYLQTSYRLVVLRGKAFFDTPHGTKLILPIIYFYQQDHHWCFQNKMSLCLLFIDMRKVLVFHHSQDFDVHHICYYMYCIYTCIIVNLLTRSSKLCPNYKCVYVSGHIAFITIRNNLIHIA